jgi:hypothetical protein
VLGEVVAAIAGAVQEAVDHSRASPSLLTAAAAAATATLTPAGQYRDHGRARGPVARPQPHRGTPGNPPARILTG